MFLIPTYLAKSPIHGMGVFTPAPIKAGTLIWKFNESVDWRISPESIAQFPEPYRSLLQAYSYVDEKGMHVLCGDNAKYMNHLDDPNCDDTGEQYTMARRDIATDEELTCNYRSFDRESALKDGKLYP